MCKENFSNSKTEYQNYCKLYTSTSSLYFLAIISNQGVISGVFEDGGSESGLYESYNNNTLDGTLSGINNTYESAEPTMLLDPVTVSHCREYPIQCGIIPNDLSITVEEAMEYSQQQVLNFPSDFNLTSISDKDIAVATATTTATAAGIASGSQMVIASPSDYGLVSQADLNSSTTEALATGIASGKQYVQDNISEFGLVTKSDIELTTASVSALPTGWTLVSTAFAITDFSIFDSATIVWVFNNSTSSWSAYSSDAAMSQKIVNNTTVSTLTSIPAGSGVWVQK